MRRHPPISAEAPSVKQTRRPGSPMRWPVQPRVARWQQVGFVPLITQMRARVSGGELFQTSSGNCR
jgi:hypothetical protein